MPIWDGNLLRMTHTVETCRDLEVLVASQIAVALLRADEENLMDEKSVLEQCEELHQAFAIFWKAVTEALLIPEILDVLAGWLSKLGFK